MKSLISIIIPAFNVENYIEECIKSIKEQTFKNYEVIIIDDGSKDGTLDAINKNIDWHFKVIMQENKGAGEARNTGIRCSNGQYIMFMDSDDKLYNNRCLQKIADNLKTHDCDVITYKMVRYYNKSKKYIIEDDITDTDRIYTNVDEYLAQTIANSRLSVSPCDKIIKSSILKEKKIYFEPMAMLEDIDWSLKLYEKINSIMVLNTPIYVYRKQRQNSTTSSYNKNKANACIEFLKYWTEYKGSKYNIYIHYISYQYLIMVAGLNKKNSSKEICKSLKKYQYLLNYYNNSKVKKARIVYKTLGFSAMKVMLNFYMKIKEKLCFYIK